MQWDIRDLSDEDLILLRDCLLFSKVEMSEDWSSPENDLFEEFISFRKKCRNTKFPIYKLLECSGVNSILKDFFELREAYNDYIEDF